MIPKPEKPPSQLKSYGLFRIKQIIKQRNFVLKHQYGFRNSHSTIDQVYRTTDAIGKGFRGKKVFTAVFLDVSQAFDKESHMGLLTKLNTQLPRAYCTSFKSYLKNRLFRVKYEDEYFQLRKIQ